MYLFENKILIWGSQYNLQNTSQSLFASILLYLCDASPLSTENIWRKKRVKENEFFSVFKSPFKSYIKNRERLFSKAANWHVWNIKGLSHCFHHTVRVIVPKRRIFHGSKRKALRHVLWNIEAAVTYVPKNRRTEISFIVPPWGMSGVQVAS